MPAPLPQATVVPARAARPARKEAQVFVDDDTVYPSSDGRRMAENTWQELAIVHARIDLDAALRPRAPFVAADLLVYPRQGNAANRTAPDVMVVFGVPRGHRMSYRVWEEGKPPDWVLEVASPSTEARDREEKRCAYQAMGVREYWMFDPKGDVYPPGEPRLQGLELGAGGYRPLRPQAVAGVPMIRSGVLRLLLRREGDLIRFRDPATGQDVLHHDEVGARADREAALRKAAEARAGEQAARIAELEAALKRRSEPSA